MGFCGTLCRVLFQFTATIIVVFVGTFVTLFVFGPNIDIQPRIKRLNFDLEVELLPPAIGEGGSSTKPFYQTLAKEVINYPKDRYIPHVTDKMCIFAEGEYLYYPTNSVPFKDPFGGPTRDITMPSIFAQRIFQSSKSQWDPNADWVIGTDSGSAKGLFKIDGLEGFLADGRNSESLNPLYMIPEPSCQPESGLLESPTRIVASTCIGGNTDIHGTDLTDSKACSPRPVLNTINPIESLINVQHQQYSNALAGGCIRVGNRVLSYPSPPTLDDRSILDQHQYWTLVDLPAISSRRGNVSVDPIGPGAFSPSLDFIASSRLAGLECESEPVGNAYSNFTESGIRTWNSNVTGFATFGELLEDNLFNVNSEDYQDAFNTTTNPIFPSCASSFGSPLLQKFTPSSHISPVTIPDPLSPANDRLIFVLTIPGDDEREEFQVLASAVLRPSCVLRDRGLSEEPKSFGEDCLSFDTYELSTDSPFWTATSTITTIGLINEGKDLAVMHYDNDRVTGEGLRNSRDRCLVAGDGSSGCHEGGKLSILSINGWLSHDTTDPVLDYYYGTYAFADKMEDSRSASIFQLAGSTKDGDYDARAAHPITDLFDYEVTETERKIILVGAHGLLRFDLNIGSNWAPSPDLTTSDVLADNSTSLSFEIEKYLWDGSDSILSLTGDNFERNDEALYTAPKVHVFEPIPSGDERDKDDLDRLIYASPRAIYEVRYKERLMGSRCVYHVFGSRGNGDVPNWTGANFASGSPDPYSAYGGGLGYNPAAGGEDLPAEKDHGLRATGSRIDWRYPFSDSFDMFNVANPVGTDGMTSQTPCGLGDDPLNPGVGSVGLFEEDNLLLSLQLPTSCETRKNAGDSCNTGVLPRIDRIVDIIPDPLDPEHVIVVRYTEFDWNIFPGPGAGDPNNPSARPTSHHLLAQHFSFRNDITSEHIRNGYKFLGIAITVIVAIATAYTFRHRSQFQPTYHGVVMNPLSAKNMIAYFGMIVEFMQLGSFSFESSIPWNPNYSPALIFNAVRLDLGVLEEIGSPTWAVANITGWSVVAAASAVLLFVVGALNLIFRLNKGKKSWNPILTFFSLIVCPVVAGVGFLPISGMLLSALGCKTSPDLTANLLNDPFAEQECFKWTYMHQFFNLFGGIPEQDPNFTDFDQYRIANSRPTGDVTFIIAIGALAIFYPMALRVSAIAQKLDPDKQITFDPAFLYYLIQFKFFLAILGALVSTNQLNYLMVLFVFNTLLLLFAVKVKPSANVNINRFRVYLYFANVWTTGMGVFSVLEDDTASTRPSFYLYIGWAVILGFVSLLPVAFFAKNVPAHLLADERVLSPDEMKAVKAAKRKMNRTIDPHPIGRSLFAIVCLMGAISNGLGAYNAQVNNRLTVPGQPWSIVMVSHIIAGLFMALNFIYLMFYKQLKKRAAFLIGLGTNFTESLKQFADNVDQSLGQSTEDWKAFEAEEKAYQAETSMFDEPSAEAGQAQLAGFVPMSVVQQQLASSSQQQQQPPPAQQQPPAAQQQPPAQQPAAMQMAEPVQEEQPAQAQMIEQQQGYQQPPAMQMSEPVQSTEAFTSARDALANEPLTAPPTAVAPQPEPEPQPQPEIQPEPEQATSSPSPVLPPPMQMPEPVQQAPETSTPPERPNAPPPPRQGEEDPPAE